MIYLSILLFFINFNIEVSLSWQRSLLPSSYNKTYSVNNISSFSWFIYKILLLFFFKIY
jgi:hypothetical protein